MTETFADFCAQQDAKNTVQLNIRKYALMLCDALKDDAPEGFDFTLHSGRKYYKVIMTNGCGSRSAHCFIDKNTGSVLKTASWRGPRKGERYNLLLIKDREWLLCNADWSGSYLYQR